MIVPFWKRMTAPGVCGVTIMPQLNTAQAASAVPVLELDTTFSVKEASQPTPARGVSYSAAAMLAGLGAPIRWAFIDRLWRISTRIDRGAIVRYFDVRIWSAVVFPSHEPSARKVFAKSGRR
jgi:hypothetical protein